MKKLSRRYFLQTVGLSSAALMLTPIAPAVAEELPDRRFVFCYFGGGWDTLMSLDPRPWGQSYDRIDQAAELVNWGAAGIDADRRAVLAQQDGLVQPSGSNITFGPVFDPLLSRADGRYDALFRRGCVINGVMMDTLTHLVGMRYFITGRMPAGARATGSSIAAEIAAQYSPDTLPALPNIAMEVEAYNTGPHHANPTRITSPEDLVRLLRQTEGTVSGTVAEAIADYRATDGRVDPGSLDRGGLMALVRGSQRDAGELVDSGFHELFRPQELTLGDGPLDNNASDQMVRAAVAYQAITNNVAQCVNLGLLAGLDTHSESWRETQARDQVRGFHALAELIRGLETTPYYSGDGTSWLDHTTVIAFSEFGRTAKLNPNGGRDHALVNSVYMAGAQAPQNQTIGATDDNGLNAVSIDAETGRPRSLTDGGQLITPRHIAASLLYGSGLDSSVYRNLEMPCLMPG